MLMVNQLIGFGVGGSVEALPTISFLSRVENAANQSSYTFAGYSFGAESPTRRIVGFVVVNGSAGPSLLGP